MQIFTGRNVESAGVAITIISAAALLHGWSRFFILLCVAVYLLDRFLPQVFNFLKNFAEPDAWPGYVALGVAVLFDEQFGGWRGDIVLIGILTTGDGRL